MVEIKKYMPADVVNQDDLHAWRASIKKSEDKNCPEEVRQFIGALATKLPDFGQIGKFKSLIAGYDLLLSGMKEYKGESINPWDIYPIEVPHMVAVDHSTAMHRIYQRRGKQGLIDFCKAKVKGTELEQVLEILNVHVFHEERTEFKRVMEEIEQSKKMDSIPHPGPLQPPTPKGEKNQLTINH